METFVYTKMKIKGRRLGLIHISCVLCGSIDKQTTSADPFLATGFVDVGRSL
jgi:hypothetical protein